MLVPSAKYMVLSAAIANPAKTANILLLNSFFSIFIIEDNTKFL